MKKIIFLMIVASFFALFAFLYFGRSRDVILISNIRSGINPQEAKVRLGILKWQSVDTSIGRDGVSEVTASAEPYNYLGCRGKVTMRFLGDRLYMVFFFPLDNPRLFQKKIAKSILLEGRGNNNGGLRVEQYDTYTVWIDEYLFHDYEAWINKNG